MGALFLLFLGLKLTGQIDWSWWYVTMPLWGGVAVFVALMVFVLFMVYLFSRDEIPKPPDPPLYPKGKFQKRLEEMAEKRGYKNN